MTEWNRGSQPLCDRHRAFECAICKRVEQQQSERKKALSKTKEGPCQK